MNLLLQVVLQRANLRSGGEKEGNKDEELYTFQEK